MNGPASELPELDRAQIPLVGLGHVSSRNATAPRMCIRIAASAIRASRARSAATIRRWQTSDSARCASDCQNRYRNARGMPDAARIATASRGLPAASAMIR